MATRNKINHHEYERKYNSGGRREINERTGKTWRQQDIKIHEDIVLERKNIKWPEMGEMTPTPKR